MLRHGRRQPHASCPACTRTGVSCRGVAAATLGMQGIPSRALRDRPPYHQPLFAAHMHSAPWGSGPSADIKSEDRMKAAMFGLGYLGTVTAACLASHGRDICGVEVDLSAAGVTRRGKPIATGKNRAVVS